MPWKFNPFTSDLDYYQSGSAGSGDVVGPASATDNAITRYNGTTGKSIQNSSASIDDDGNLTVIGNYTLKDAATAVKAYRFFTDGTDLDIAGAGKPIYLSVFDNPDFTGTQRSYMKFGQGSSFVALSGGTWEWKDTIDGTAQASINSANGVGDFNDVTVNDEAYGSGWNGSVEVPTKNAVYDKIETLGGVPTSSFRAERNASDQACGANATTDLIYDLEKFDADGEYNATTGVFTAAATGIYFVYAAAFIASTPVDQAQYVMNVEVNGSVVIAKTNRASGTGSFSADVTGTLSLTAGNTVNISLFTNNANNVNAGTKSYFTMFRHH